MLSRPEGIERRGAELRTVNGASSADTSRCRRPQPASAGARAAVDVQSRRNGSLGVVNTTRVDPEVSTPRFPTAAACRPEGLTPMRFVGPADVLSWVFTGKASGATLTFSRTPRSATPSGERLVLTIATTGLASAFRAGKSRRDRQGS